VGAHCLLEAGTEQGVADFDEKPWSLFVAPVDKLAELMRSELAKWGDVIRQAKITIDS